MDFDISLHSFIVLNGLGTSTTPVIVMIISAYTVVMVDFSMSWACGSAYGAILKCFFI